MNGMIVNSKEHRIGEQFLSSFPRPTKSYWHTYYQYKLSIRPHSYMDPKMFLFHKLEAKELKERKVKDYEYKTTISA